MKPEIMVFSAWMQTNHLSGRPWKDLICSTSQYSVFVKGSQRHTWTFLLTHVSPPVHPTPHLLKLSKVRTSCQPLPFTSSGYYSVLWLPPALCLKPKDSHLLKINNKQREQATSLFCHLFWEHDVMLDLFSKCCNWLTDI